MAGMRKRQGYYSGTDVSGFIADHLTWAQTMAYMAYRIIAICKRR